MGFVNDHLGGYAARAGWLLVAGIAVVASPFWAETYRNSGPPFEIDYPDGWRVLPGEGGIATRAVGPGGSMNVSVAAARRPDFDADEFTGSELEQIADGLVAATASALREFELVERGRTELGGKPAAFFSYRAVVKGRDGPIHTVGTYVATAHRGLVYSVTGVSERREQRRATAAIRKASESFRFLEAGSAGPGG
jgi:hypothetical protein